MESPGVMGRLRSRQSQWVSAGGGVVVRTGLRTKEVELGACEKGLSKPGIKGRNVRRKPSREAWATAFERESVRSWTTTAWHKPKQGCIRTLATHIGAAVCSLMLLWSLAEHMLHLRGNNRGTGAQAEERKKGRRPRFNNRIFTAEIFLLFPFLIQQPKDTRKIL